MIEFADWYFISFQQVYSKAFRNLLSNRNSFISFKSISFRSWILILLNWNFKIQKNWNSVSWNKLIRKKNCRIILGYTFFCLKTFFESFKLIHKKLEVLNLKDRTKVPLSGSTRNELWIFSWGDLCFLTHIVLKSKTLKRTKKSNLVIIYKIVLTKIDIFKIFVFLMRLTIGFLNVYWNIGWIIRDPLIEVFRDIENSNPTI